MRVHSSRPDMPCMKQQRLQHRKLHSLCTTWARLLVLVDPKDAYFVQAGELSYKQHHKDNDIQPQRLPSEVCAMRCQEEEHNWNYCKELAVAGVLDSVVQLFPEGQAVVLPLVHLNGRPLVPMQQVVGDNPVQQVHVCPRHPSVHHQGEYEPRQEDQRYNERPCARRVQPFDVLVGGLRLSPLHLRAPMRVPERTRTRHQPAGAWAPHRYQSFHRTLKTKELMSPSHCSAQAGMSRTVWNYQHRAPRKLLVCATARPRAWPAPARGPHLQAILACGRRGRTRVMAGGSRAGSAHPGFTPCAGGEPDAALAVQDQVWGPAPDSGPTFWDELQTPAPG